MTYKKMPDWIQPYKSLWLSQGKIKELFSIDGRHFGPWFDSVRGRINFITEESKNRTGPVKRYLVKHVWAVSLAHNITLQPSEKTSPYEAVVLERDKLRTELEKERDKLRTELEKERDKLRTELEKERLRMKVRIVEVDSTNQSVNLIKLLASATDAQPAPGVYFLLGKEGDVVYVGQSKNVLSRMVGHQEKEFQTVRMIHIKSDSERLEIEGFLIKSLTPALNIKGIGFRRETAPA